MVKVSSLILIMHLNPPGRLASNTHMLINIHEASRHHSSMRNLAGREVSPRVIHFRCLLLASHAWSNMDEKIHVDLEDFSEEQFMESFLKEIQSEEAVFIIGIFVALLLVVLTIGKKKQSQSRQEAYQSKHSYKTLLELVSITIIIIVVCI